MEFVSAATARKMVKDYENAINERFLNDLNNKIIACAKKGLNECCISLHGYSKEEKGNLMLFLAQHGFNCIPHLVVGQPLNDYKITW